MAIAICFVVVVLVYQHLSLLSSYEYVFMSRLLRKIDYEASVVTLIPLILLLQNSSASVVSEVRH